MALSVPLIVAAATVKIAIPAFELDEAPAILASRLPEYYAAAIDAAQCATTVPAAKFSRDATDALNACEENVACVSGVGRMLGVDYVLVGDFAKSGAEFDTHLTLVNVRTRSVVKQLDSHYKGGLRDLGSSVRELVPMLCKEVDPRWQDPSVKTAEENLEGLSFDEDGLAPKASPAVVPPAPPPAPAPPPQEFAALPDDRTAGHPSPDVDPLLAPPAVDPTLEPIEPAAPTPKAAPPKVPPPEPTKTPAAAPANVPLPTPPPAAPKPALRAQPEHAPAPAPTPPKPAAPEPKSAVAMGAEPKPPPAPKPEPAKPPSAPVAEVPKSPQQKPVPSPVERPESTRPAPAPMAEATKPTPVAPRKVDLQPRLLGFVPMPASHSARTISYALMGSAGAVTLIAAGTGYGALAAARSRLTATDLSAYNSAQSSAVTRGTVSNVSFGLAGAAALTSVVIWFAGDHLFHDNPVIRQTPSP